MVSRADQIETDPLRALYARLNALEAEVRELRAGRRLEAATVGAGGLAVTGGGTVQVTAGGQVIVYDEQGNGMIRLGQVPFGDGSTKPGLVAFRSTAEGGTVAMTLFDGVWAVWDRQSNMVMSTDEVSGQGIARPWLPVTWAGIDYTQWPGTTNAAFAAIVETLLPRQQPRIYLRIRHTTDASGTTGELRVMCNGVQLGTTIAVAFAQGITDIGPVALPPAAFGAIMGLSVDGRRTAGAGVVRATVTASWTQQS
ncbi:hypothetical protein [Micromonospora rubida]|uniref:hypothetical protein n=1 Tax=Micromonospora rubida TaxID=2697657 RepID=UPI00137663D8|nr:hypothetical protein [Micromonospora rubida]NBE80302.1 hypothetical protein [Micromonospora rubida]